MSDQRFHKLAKEPAKRKRARERAFRPYAIQIGWITYEWNRLQEALGELFSDIVQPDTKRIGYAIWHSTDNDRTLRNMLRETTEASKAENKIEQRPESFRGVVVGKARARRRAARTISYVVIARSEATK